MRVGVAGGERGATPTEGGGREATKASMSQNVDRERRVPLPLIHRLVENCASPGVGRVAGTRGDDNRSVTVPRTTGVQWHSRRVQLIRGPLDPPQRFLAL